MVCMLIHFINVLFYLINLFFVIFLFFLFSLLLFLLLNHFVRLKFNRLTIIHLSHGQCFFFLSLSLCVYIFIYIICLCMRVRVRVRACMCLVYYGLFYYLLNKCVERVRTPTNFTIISRIFVLLSFQISPM